jgi:hypothetical protein
MLGERVDNSPWSDRVNAVQPIVRTCIECGCEYTRRMASGRLRSPQRWRRALYCSRQCATEYHKRWKASPQTGHVSGLDPPAPPSKPKMRALARSPGRPSNRTGRESIERAERASSILDLRFQGFTFKQIGAMQGVSAPSIHRLFWRALRSCPYDPARLRRLAARDGALLIDNPT